MNAIQLQLPETQYNTFITYFMLHIYCVHCTNEQDQHKKNKKTQEKN